jgi:hypothetical protein
MRASALADEIVDHPDGWMGELTEQPETLAAVVEPMELLHLKGIAACYAAFT